MFRGVSAIECVLERRPQTSPDACSECVGRAHRRPGAARQSAAPISSAASFA